MKASRRARQHQPSPPASAFPWEEVMGFLMGVLGWPPQAAWAATPREVELAISGRLGRKASQGMDGTRLDELMADFPD
ncbi:MAG: phage tail assembly chaperone [Bosea sp. (in: a-proteobacteria)]